jgi:hypothetical protein
MALTREMLAKVAERLDELGPRLTTGREIAMLVEELASKIRAAQERGCTYDQIAQMITELGYPIKVNALRIAIQRQRKAPASGVKKNGAASRPRNGRRPPATPADASPAQRNSGEKNGERPPSGAAKRHVAPEG